MEVGFGRSTDYRFVNQGNFPTYSNSYELSVNIVLEQDL